MGKEIIHLNLHVGVQKEGEEKLLVGSRGGRRRNGIQLGNRPGMLVLDQLEEKRNRSWACVSTELRSKLDL